MTNACIKHEWNASFAAINLSTKYGRARRSGTELTNGPKKPLSIIYLFRFCRVFGAILKYKHEQWHFVVERKKGVQKFISTAFADNGRRGGESWKKVSMNAGDNRRHSGNIWGLGGKAAWNSRRGSTTRSSGILLLLHCNTRWVPNWNLMEISNETPSVIMAESRNGTIRFILIDAHSVTLN